VLRMILACGLMLTATVASAQERIALLTRSDATGLSMLELDATVSGFGALRSVTPVPRTPGDNFVGVPIVVSGARYVGWLSAGRSGSDPRYIQVFDRRTRTTQLAGTTLANRIVADPLRPRVFSERPLGTTSARAGVFVADLETGLTRTVFDSDTTPAVAALDLSYAADPDRVIVWTTPLTLEPNPPQTAVVVDVASGHVVRSFGLPFRPYGGFQVSRDGQRLYIQPVLMFGAAAPIIALDTTTGLEIGRSANVPPLRWQLDEPNGRILVSDGESGVLAALDAVTLHTLGSVRVPPSTFTLLPGRWMTGAYVLRTALSDTCSFVVEALGPNGTLRDRVDVVATTGQHPAYCTGLQAVLLRSPFAPARLDARVNGRTVSLSWVNPGDVSGFELEVGLSPGSTFMRVPLDLHTTSVTYAGVPAGVYYARVKATNEMGSSRPSPELRIEVQ
jgi:hypothetical protein